jgi:hypothetical protein
LNQGSFTRAAEHLHLLRRQCQDCRQKPHQIQSRLFVARKSCLVIIVLVGLVLTILDPDGSPSKGVATAATTAVVAVLQEDV